MRRGPQEAPRLKLQSRAARFQLPPGRWRPGRWRLGRWRPRRWRDGGVGLRPQFSHHPTGRHRARRRRPRGGTNKGSCPKRAQTQDPRSSSRRRSHHGCHQSLLRWHALPLETTKIFCGVLPLPRSFGLRLAQMATVRQEHNTPKGQQHRRPPYDVPPRRPTERGTAHNRPRTLSARHTEQRVPQGCRGRQLAPKPKPPPSGMYKVSPASVRLRMLGGTEEALGRRFLVPSPRTARSRHVRRTLKGILSGRITGGQALVGVRRDLFRQGRRCLRAALYLPKQPWAPTCYRSRQ